MSAVEAEAARAPQPDPKGGSEHRGFRLVRKKVKQMAYLARNLLVTREHSVRAIEEVAELKDGDGDERGAESRTSGKKTRPDGEDHQADEGQLVGRGRSLRDQRDGECGKRPHQPGVEELVVGFTSREVDAARLAEEPSAHL